MIVGVAAFFARGYIARWLFGKDDLDEERSGQLPFPPRKSKMLEAPSRPRRSEPARFAPAPVKQREAPEKKRISFEKPEEVEEVEDEEESEVDDPNFTPL